MARAHTIAILGATSRIGRDFIASYPDPATLRLFARKRWQPYSEFPDGDYGAVINFVGVGDPARAREMGTKILSVTRQYDEMALDFQARHPGTRYIFLSSGAAYGGEFTAPACDGGETPIAANNTGNYYGAAKQEAEARHRALPGQSIFDLRVFNYVSREMDLTAPYLLADMVHCVQDCCVFRTADWPMTRDYLHPNDFAQLVRCCLVADGNMALDCYSQAPITKRELLDLMASHFGMQYEITSVPANSNVTGEKPHYYSQSRRAAALGYIPSWSSQSGILAEVSAILSRN